LVNDQIKVYVSACLCVRESNSQSTKPSPIGEKRQRLYSQIVEEKKKKGIKKLRAELSIGRQSPR